LAYSGSDSKCETPKSPPGDYNQALTKIPFENGGSSV